MMHGLEKFGKCCLVNTNRDFICFLFKDVGARECYLLPPPRFIAWLIYLLSPPKAKSANGLMFSCWSQLFMSSSRCASFEDPWQWVGEGSPPLQNTHLIPAMHHFSLSSPIFPKSQSQRFSLEAAQIRQPRIGGGGGEKRWLYPKKVELVLRGVLKKMHTSWSQNFFSIQKGLQR